MKDNHINFLYKLKHTCFGIKGFSLLLAMTLFLLPAAGVFVYGEEGTAGQAQEALSGNDGTSVTLESGTSVVLESGTFDQDLKVTACYYDEAIDTPYYFTVPYNDSFFDRDPEVFYMDLAQASYGLTISAFRLAPDEEIATDQNSASFLSSIGFEDFESFWYDQDSTEDSISNVIAEKKIGDETVIAFACNGAGYGDEWLSNLTMGTGTEHEGFSKSAKICLQRLQDYLERHPVTGKVKLWITGYSRASAVGNLLAGYVIEAGLFSDVYGYFFATPNTTKEPEAYPGIFNIVGQYDPVSWIPFSNWGYGRNGVDLYLPAQESNSSFTGIFPAADQVYEGLRGESFHTNPELNRQLYVLEKLTSGLFSTPEDYVTMVQPQLLSLFGSDDSQDIFSMLEQAIESISTFTPLQQSVANTLVAYMDSVVYEYISGNESQISQGKWSLNSTLSQNLFSEHMAYVYGTWISSTEDPTQLFVDSTTTIHLVIQGNFDMEVWDDYGLVETVSSQDEQVVYQPGSENRSEDGDLVSLYAKNSDGSAVINIPADRNYSLKLLADGNQDITLFADIYSYDIEDYVNEIILFHAQEDQCILISNLSDEDSMTITTEEGEELTTLRQTMPQTLASVVAWEKMANGTFTVHQVLYAITFFILMPLILMVTALILFLVGRKKRWGRNGRPVTVCFCLNALVLAAGAFIFRMLLPNLLQVTIAYGFLALVFTVLSILRIVRRRRRALAAAVS